MKIKTIILRDSADTLFDDLIIFEEEIDRIDVFNAIERAKQKEDYTNEDVYKELDKLGKYTLQWIGQYEIFEY